MSRMQGVHSVEHFRMLARRRLPKSIFEFVDGGAGQELTLRDNRHGFERIRLVPRVLTDVSRPDVATSIGAERFPTPLVISPMGSCSLVWPKADIAIARAAALAASRVRYSGQKQHRGNDDSPPYIID